MKRDSTNDAWYEFLAREEPSYFCTATFKQEVTNKAAEKKFSRLMAAANDILGAKFRCFYVIEGEPDGGKRPHIHFVIAGVPYSAVARRQLQRVWNKIGGISHIVRFDEAKREAGIHYILKTVRSGRSDQVNFVSPDKAQTARPAKQASGPSAREVAPQMPAADVSRNNADMITLPSMTIRRGLGFHVQREDAYLIIVLPLTAPRPSKSSGKTNVIGSTGGPRATFAEFDGRPILVNVVAMVNPNRPAWTQRAYALLAKWEGKLS